MKEVLCPFRNVNVKVNSMPFRQEDIYIDEQPGEIFDMAKVLGQFLLTKIVNQFIGAIFLNVNT